MDTHNLVRVLVHASVRVSHRFIHTDREWIILFMMDCVARKYYQKQVNVRLHTQYHTKSELQHMIVRQANQLLGNTKYTVLSTPFCYQLVSLGLPIQLSAPGASCTAFYL
jgi:hypothetical protein